MNKEKQKGITLIALIITIIIMLILVAVTVSVAINGNLFGKAEEAVDRTNKKVGDLQNDIDHYTEKLNGLGTNDNYSNDYERYYANIKKAQDLLTKTRAEIGKTSAYAALVNRFEHTRDNIKNVNENGGTISSTGSNITIPLVNGGQKTIVLNSLESAEEGIRTAKEEAMKIINNYTYDGIHILRDGYTGTVLCGDYGERELFLELPAITESDIGKNSTTLQMIPYNFYLKRLEIAEKFVGGVCEILRENTSDKEKEVAIGLIGAETIEIALEENVLRWLVENRFGTDMNKQGTDWGDDWDTDITALEENLKELENASSSGTSDDASNLYDANQIRSQIRALKTSRENRNFYQEMMNAAMNEIDRIAKEASYKEVFILKGNYEDIENLTREGLGVTIDCTTSPTAHQATIDSVNTAIEKVKEQIVKLQPLEENA